MAASHSRIWYGRTAAQALSPMMGRELADPGQLVDDLHALRRLDNASLTLERRLIALEAVAAAA